MTTLDKVNIRRLLMYIEKELNKILNKILKQARANNESDVWIKYSIDNFLWEVACKKGIKGYEIAYSNNSLICELDVNDNLIYIQSILSHISEDFNAF